MEESIWSPPSSSQPLRRGKASAGAWQGLLQLRPTASRGSRLAEPGLARQWGEERSAGCGMSPVHGHHPVLASSSPSPPQAGVSRPSAGLVSLSLHGPAGAQESPLVQRGDRHSQEGQRKAELLLGELLGQGRPLS